MATLVDNVYVGGRFYGPDHGGDAEVTPEIAALITDPKAWGGAPPTSPASSSVEIEGVPLHQQTVVVDPAGTMAPAEAEAAQAAIEAEMRAAAAEPPAGTAPGTPDEIIDGFDWLANPDAQAAVELLEESAVPHIDDTAAADPAPEALALSGNGDTP